ncbi:helix-turn-helix transcriptional regulator [Chitinophaga sedimenti]|uniref:helix-turn-helix domain-containing protein n=1 Tax=Chitinophaga sedimenti TaxID=2033606 RepID=UPI00200392FA|nr:helix-turn-helix transcriptional regulator [Chitinophaga sedimenti]MCK7556826.1 helix-turn-helix transcriptional regulator [Chitinophaga sedimenti]
MKTPGGYRFTQEDRAAVIAAGKLQLENMDTFLSLEEMASSVLLHPKKLNEGFKLMHGMSSQEWVLEQKLQRGLELLKTTDQTLLQIGLEIGYGSLSSFSKAFKKRFNVTPSSVRK